MSPPRLHWHSGTPEVQRAVERALAAPGPQVLRDNPRRRLLRVDSPEAGPLLVKHFRTRSGLHPLREHVKATLGRSPGDREVRRLTRLHAAGVPVPAPLAHGRLPDGDPLLVLPWLEGRPLAELLAGPHPARRRALVALGRAVAALHGAGLVHGDLHGENLLFAGERPILLDLQHAHIRLGPWGRLRDLGALDYSLRDRASLADRVRLRAAALGLSRPFDARARRLLRAVGRAASRRAVAHGTSRTRHRMRPGRLVAGLRLGAGTGLRWRAFPAELVARALEAHEAAGERKDALVLQQGPRGRVTRVQVDDRSWVVKEGRADGPLRALADLVRGSPARRGWRGGHGLLAREVSAALPLAFVERRRLGLPVRSWLVLEDLAPAPDAVTASSEAPAAVSEALLELLHALHRRQVDHGDLKGTHIFLRAEAGGGPPRAVLVDLEHVRFARRLSESRRIQALAELNASLPDAVPAALRREVFLRYATRHPFRVGRVAALERIVRASLQRHHRWSGADCACAGAALPPSRSRGLRPSSG